MEFSGLTNKPCGRWTGNKKSIWSGLRVSDCDCFVRVLQSFATRHWAKEGSNLLWGCECVGRPSKLISTTCVTCKYFMLGTA